MTSSMTVRSLEPRGEKATTEEWSSYAVAGRSPAASASGKTACG